MTRDFDKNPYDHQEKRVCDYLVGIIPDIGGGDDPVGFLIASHAALREDIKELKDYLDRSKR